MGVMTVLPENEKRLKSQLEQRISAAVADGRRSHFVIGEALDAILDLKLYRDEYASFDDYCQTEWDFSGPIGRRAANSYRVSKTLESAEQSAPDVYWSILTGLQPSHAEQLSKLPESAQPAAWSEARQSTTTPTVKALEDVVNRHKDRLAELPNMTAAEESEFNQVVESETMEAYQNGKVKEVADISAKRMRSVRRGIPMALEAKFRDAIRMTDLLAKEFERLGA